MKALGAILEGVEPGQVDIRLPFRADLTQQHGFRHAGAMTNAVDSAPGYSAPALSRRGGSAHGEVQVNLMRPDEGDSISVRGRVLKAGRRRGASWRPLASCLPGLSFGSSPHRTLGSGWHTSTG